MIQLLAIVLMSALHAGPSIAQQYPLPVTYDTVIKSPADPRITISYKSPDAHVCATAFETQKQYTGYVNIPPFTLSPAEQNYPINTFFWFFEARENPETAPLTIWLSGGPGSSSMIGLFSELGPCELVEGPNGSYVSQPRVWGWDRSSNILFIDQPTQVGFSYDEPVNVSVDFSKGYWADLDQRMEPSPLPADIPEWRFKNGTFPSASSRKTENLTVIAADSSWHFLQGFLSAFPQYNPGVRSDSDTVNPSEINLFAESYGGVYGPVFADHYEEQNDRRKKGDLPAETLEIRVGSVGIVNGIMDVRTSTTSGLLFAYNNTYGIEGYDLTTYQNAISDVYAEGGCVDLVDQCAASAAANDPQGLGTVQEVNDICVAALLTCQTNVGPAYLPGRSIYDIRALPTVGPSDALETYLNEEHIMQSVGAPVNFTSTNNMVLDAFSYNGDSARGGALEAVADLLARGIKVGLIYGDADIICNWYGGQNNSLEIASRVPGYETAFKEAGYADIQVNESYVGGAVRQHGNLSFSRIYDSGHYVPTFQPETAFTVFSRIIHGDDISTGRDVDLSSFSTEGPSTSEHRNDPGESPPSICWIRQAILACTEEENAAIIAGNGTVKAGIWYPSEGDVPTSAGESKPQPTATNSVPMTGVYTATGDQKVKQTSGASALRFNLPFSRSRREITGDPLSEPGDSRDKDSSIRNGLIGGLAAAVALFL
ncbi:hypothetical protein J4E89_004370 [Alternaria sp. Ai002NY15]|nr:hypothetical protein J4E89_004370 [Alternaria sp. Ai002NY15]